MVTIGFIEKVKNVKLLPQRRRMMTDEKQLQ